MATINISNLTFTHRGDYDGSTAYVKNDVVYYSSNGNAYIAKQGTTGNAPTNGTYWSQFAAGSGGIWNAGLSLGSAGQSVKVNAAGNALEFGTIQSDFVKLASQSLDGTGVNIVEFQNCFSSANDALYGGYQVIIFSQNNGANDGLNVRYMYGTNTEISGATDYTRSGSEGYGQTNNSNRAVGYTVDSDGRNSMDWENWGQNGGNDATEGNMSVAWFQGGMYRNDCAKSCWVNSAMRDASSPNYVIGKNAVYRYHGTQNITGLKFYVNNGAMSNGAITLWGMKK